MAPTLSCKDESCFYQGLPAKNLASLDTVTLCYLNECDKKNGFHFFNFETT